MITEDAILNFISTQGIGNWFQCFPVYPVLNLSSGSGSGSVSVSGSGSEFRIPAFPHVPARGKDKTLAGESSISTHLRRRHFAITPD